MTPPLSDHPVARRDVVLVVDDSPDTLGMIHHALDNAGLTALLALEGRQALSIADKMVPDIILMDAVMPEMDGFETCRQLKQQPALHPIPVIFMTGLSDTDDILRGFDAGGVDYLTKPVHPDELVARIRVHLANARLTQSARTALDRAGQLMFATDSHGTLRWATPQAEQLLHAQPFDPGFIAQSLRHWLSEPPERGQQRALGDAGLRLRFLGTPAPGEYLFRLLQRDGEAELALLREALHLTQREAQVLLWIAQGKTNREIGEILSLSPRTVNKHLEQIFRKLGVENRTSAAAMAISHLTQT